MRKVKGEEGLKTQFSPRRQGYFRERETPRYQAPPSPELPELKYEGMWEYCNRDCVKPQDGSPNGHACH